MLATKESTGKYLRKKGKEGRRREGKRREIGREKRRGERQERAVFILYSQHLWQDITLLTDILFLQNIRGKGDNGGLMEKLDIEANWGLRWRHTAKREKLRNNVRNDT